MSDARVLRVLLDGSEMAPADARALWLRFSQWMEQRVGDLAGFAKAEGLASVHPEMHAGAPVLIASRSGAQRVYGPAPERKGKSTRRSGS